MKHRVPPAVKEVRAHLVKDGKEVSENIPPHKNVAELLKRFASDKNFSKSILLDALEFGEDAEKSGSYTGKGLRRRQYTFKEFDEVSNRFANVLKNAQLGSEPSIGFIGENIAEMHITYIATAKLGGLCAPLNPKDSLEKWLLAFKDCGVSAIVVQEKFIKSDKFNSLVKELGTLKSIFVVSHDEIASPQLNLKLQVEIFAKCLEKAPADFSADAMLTWIRPFLLVYTSGTTGSPKGVVISLDTIWRCADSINQHFSVGEGSSTYAQLSGFHVNHIVVSFWGALAGGYRCFMTNRFIPKFYFDILNVEKINVSSVVPTNLAYALREEESLDAPVFKKRYGLDSQHLIIICGAGDLALELATQFSQRTGLQITQGWGMSEGTCYSSMNIWPQSWLLYWLTLGSIGLEMSTSNMAIAGIDAELKPLEKNGRLTFLTEREMTEKDKVGMIALRGYVSSLGYYNNDKVNAETNVGGWLLTGDAGCAFFLGDTPGFKQFRNDLRQLKPNEFIKRYPFIEEKYQSLLAKLKNSQEEAAFLNAILKEFPTFVKVPLIYIKGRIKDILICKGQNIPCDEIEAGALKNPGVFEAVAVPIGDQIDGEVPGLVITRHPKSKLSAEEILKYCCNRDILPRLYWPVMTAIVKDIPKTPTGKYQRVKAREIFSGEGLKAPFKTALNNIEVVDLALAADYDLKRRTK